MALWLPEILGTHLFHALAGTFSMCIVLVPAFSWLCVHKSDKRFFGGKNHSSCDALLDSGINNHLNSMLMEHAVFLSFLELVELVLCLGLLNQCLMWPKSWT